MKLIVCAVTLLMVSMGVNVSAAVRPEDSLVLDRWEVKVGPFISNLNTNLRFDTRLNNGTTISFEDDLNLDDKQTLLVLRGSLVLGKRHQLSIGYVDTNRSGTTELSRSIEFGDEIFEINAEVDSFFDVEFINADYTLWVVSSQRTAFGLLAGVTWVDVAAGIEARVGGLPGSAGTDFSFSGPVPQVGLRFRQALTQKLMFKAVGTFLTFNDIDNISGDIYNIGFALEHNTFKHVGFGADLGATEYDLDSAKEGALGNFTFKSTGLALYAKLYF
ncbi:MAG: hypothetical protein P8Y44_01860 [Acidobacteriota bacterium]